MSYSLEGGPESDKQERRSVRIIMNERQVKHPLEMTVGELSKLQEEDDSLEAVRKAA